MASKKKYDCCRCNNTGKCLCCSCAKAGSLCTNCLPLKRGHCRNARPDISWAVPPSVQSSSTQNSITSVSSLILTPTLSSSLTPVSTQVPRDQSSTNDGPPSLSMSNYVPSLPFSSLPEFIPVSDARFV